MVVKLDKKLSSKKIKDFNKFLANSFIMGECSCIRCTSNNYDQSSYSLLHTIDLNKVPYKRIFTTYSKENFINFLKGAWKTFHEQELDLENKNTTPEDEEENNEEVKKINFSKENILSFTDTEHHDLLNYLIQEAKIYSFFEE